MKYLIAVFAVFFTLVDLAALRAASKADDEAQKHWEDVE